MNAFRWFESSLAGNDSKTALVSGLGKARRSVTFGDLAERVDRVAGELAEAGLKPGDRVLLAVPVSIETYVTMLALLKAGLVIMYIDPGHGARKIAGILRAWPPAAVVANASILMLRFVVPELRQIPLRFVVGASSIGARSLSAVGPAGRCISTVSRSPADSALLTFTSGSTGEPKPVVRTHGFLKQQMSMLLKLAPVAENDVDFVAMPMFVLFNLVRGVTSVIPACDMKHPGRASPSLIVQQINSERATRMTAAPALLERMARYSLRSGRTLNHMRCISTGGGPVSPFLPGLLRRAAPGVSIQMVYGSTEAEPIAVIMDQQVSVSARRRMQWGDGLVVGHPVDGCEVQVVASEPACALGPLTRDRFEQLTCPQGEIGEIVVAGKHVLDSYADPARNRLTKFSVDDRVWHRTGDAGYFDADGQLWLVGRCSAAIHDERGIVYPFQVEFALSGAAGVRRAALISRRGQRVLVLETRGAEFSADCAAAARCVAKHHIDRIVTVRRIPVDKRHSSKIDYGALDRVLDGRFGVLRLVLVDLVASVFQVARHAIVQVWRRCQRTGSASKVAQCPPGTE